MFSNLLIIIGGILIFLGSIGMINQKDLYTRIQFGGISDTVGTFTVLIGLALKNQEIIFRFIIIGLLVLLIGPVLSHAIAHSAAHNKIKVRDND
ncbi:multicomponent Na+:H+ antiporter subunit G [Marinitoga hydrogenitolerans DSM 16785]|uniref:Multicomponent Na+:H+ antiporter subunit G n=1 Tax=Marinitoga hydrogenitolerans (strain DSM 16785 / JCM 12826 / AT1271) TaxID=1122195 RepID=A0A1M4SMC5_MARH1|nr:monovalent cation/H(+) antiporter subunit G [Marinitoga hydrogenitolerans]SHE33127.1 multicomponent Na+:H+ antiporter subunit G [Marinitoga hydrogenitolerans DSM 16785]